MRRITQPWLKLGLSAGYLLFALMMNRLGVRCLFLQFLHFPCPGCGMTRALISLMHFDLAAAFSYHPMVFLLPLMYLWFLLDGNVFPKPWMDKTFGVVMIAGFGLNWIRALALC